MSYNFWKNLKNQWQLVFLSALLLASLSFAISTILPIKYESTVSMLVIQKQSAEKVDAFSAAKSAEYLSQIFSRVIYTNRFFQELFKSPYPINNDFPQDPEEWKKAWKKTVSVKKINNTGILKITVLASSRKQAENIAQAIAWNFSQHGQEYHGGGDRVEIKMIDGPITPQDPAWPKIWLNTLLGALVGIGIAGSMVYFFPQARIFKKRSRNQIKFDNPEEYLAEWQAVSNNSAIDNE